jgi:hypothetical protein
MLGDNYGFGCERQIALPEQSDSGNGTQSQKNDPRGATALCSGFARSIEVDAASPTHVRLHQ